MERYHNRGDNEFYIACSRIVQEGIGCVLSKDLLEIPAASKENVAKMIATVRRIAEGDGKIDFLFEETENYHGVALAIIEELESRYGRIRIIDYISKPTKIVEDYLSIS